MRTARRSATALTIAVLFTTLVPVCVPSQETSGGNPPQTPRQQKPCGGIRNPWFPRWLATTPQSAFGPESQSAKQGRIEFQKAGCASCHGTDAVGGSGPSLLRSAAVRRDSCGDDIKNAIIKGFPNKGMPAASLSEAQAFQIADYLHRRVDEIDFEPSFSRAQVKQMLLTGNAAAGKAYFDGAGRCSSCHSATGDLKGISSKYDPVALQLRFLSPPGEVSAIVTLVSGQQFKGQLLARDAFYVSIQGDDGWGHTWPLQEVKVDLHDPLAAHWELLPKYSDTEIHDVLAYLETLK